MLFRSNPKPQTPCFRVRVSSLSMDIESGKVDISGVKIFNGIISIKTKDKGSLNPPSQMLKLAITANRLLFIDSQVDDLEIDDIYEKEKDSRFFYIIPTSDLRGRIILFKIVFFHH